MLVVVKARLQAIKLIGNGLYDSRPALSKAYCTVSAIWYNRWLLLGTLTPVAIL